MFLNHKMDKVNEEIQSDEVIGSPLPSPDKKKFKMKIRGDCFLYTSFYMIKKWFLILVAIRNLPQFQQSAQKMFRFETQDKWFVVGLIFALPVLIPVAALFLALALLLLLLLLLTFIMAIILLFLLIFIIDMPLLIVLLIQGALLAATYLNLEEVTSIDFDSYLIYLEILLLMVFSYNALEEAGNAADNMLFLVSHYKKNSEQSNFYGFFIFVSILPQIVQIGVTALVSYLAPEVILASDGAIASLRNFAGLYIIIKANCFMTAFLRETKWHNFHWILFKYLEDNKKVNMIHVQADEVDKKIYELKREKIYQYKGFGIRFDKDFMDNLGLFVFKWVIKLIIFAIILGLFINIVYSFYNTDSTSTTSSATTTTVSNTTTVL